MVEEFSQAVANLKESPLLQRTLFVVIGTLLLTDVAVPLTTPPSLSSFLPAILFRILPFQLSFYALLCLLVVRYAKGKESTYALAGAMAFTIGAILAEVIILAIGL